MLSRKSSKQNGRGSEGVQVMGKPLQLQSGACSELKGVAYEYIEEDLSNKSTLLLEYNPVHKKVPVLHHGKPISESLVILEYIEETWQENPILPKDPRERAAARFWSRFLDDKCSLALWMSCWTEGETQQNFMEQAKECLHLLEEELKGKKFFGGDSIGMVDIAASFIAHWLGVLEEVAGISLLDEEKYPNLCKWTEEFLKSDAVMECLPKRANLLAFFQARKQAISATMASVN